MDKQERIVCAAVRFNPFIWGWEHSAHHEIICGVDYKTIKISHMAKNIEQGFITSKNRFVDAKEAMEIAIECHQLKREALFYDEMQDHISHNSEHADQIAGEYKKFIGELIERGLKPEDLY